MSEGGGRLALFRGFGVELEYMIVDGDTLDVRPVADRLLAASRGGAGEAGAAPRGSADGPDDATVREAPPSEVESGPVTWSNELVLHVVELRTTSPAPRLDPDLAAGLQRSVRAANARLEPLGARLMPGGMHPWMDPSRETRIWPHEHDEIYRAFDRIFGVSGHGWSNLQSTHLNLPFRNDEEFARLHAAVRVLLPLLPALSASSPVRDGSAPGALDERLVAYAANAKRIPSVTGEVIPEPVSGEEDYRARILKPLFEDLAEHDPDGILAHEWVNARGAIARFDRGSIEIRLLDTQECPAADIAILRGITAVLEALVEGRMGDLSRANGIGTRRLARILADTIRYGDRAAVGDRELLEALGLCRNVTDAADAWRCLLEAAGATPVPDDPLDHILREGPLARRILRALGGDLRREPLREVYEELCACLEEGRQFRSGKGIAARA